MGMIPELAVKRRVSDSNRLFWALSVLFSGLNGEATIALRRPNSMACILLQGIGKLPKSDILRRLGLPGGIAAGAALP